MAIGYLGTNWQISRCQVGGTRDITTGYDPSDSATILIGGAGWCTYPSIAHSAALWQGGAFTQSLATTGAYLGYKLSPAVTSGTINLTFPNDYAGGWMGGAFSGAINQTTPIRQTFSTTGSASLAFTNVLVGSLLVFLNAHSGSAGTNPYTNGSTNCTVFGEAQSPGGCEPTDNSYPQRGGGAIAYKIATSTSETLTLSWVNATNFIAYGIEVAVPVVASQSSTWFM